jgi:hypothetical protein
VRRAELASRDAWKKGFIYNDKSRNAVRKKLIEGGRERGEREGKIMR